MQKETLKYISDTLSADNIHYEFLEFNASIKDLASYWVGEYQETEPMNEDGMEEATFILTGTSGDQITLETEKKKIKTLFPAITGKQAILPNGSRVAIFYANALPVPTGIADYKRLQINLKVKEWMVSES